MAALRMVHHLNADVARAGLLHKAVDAGVDGSNEVGVVAISTPATADFLQSLHCSGLHFGGLFRIVGQSL